MESPLVEELIRSVMEQSCLLAGSDNSYIIEKIRELKGANNSLDLLNKEERRILRSEISDTQLESFI